VETLKIPPSSGIFIEIIKLDINFHDKGIDFLK